MTLNHHESWGGISFNMADHRNVGLAALDASRDAGNRWVFPDPTLEPWDGVRYVAVSGSPHTSHAVDVGAYLEGGDRFTRVSRRVPRARRRQRARDVDGVTPVGPVPRSAANTR